MRKFQLHIDITFYIQSDFFTSTTCWSAFLAHISAQNMISKNKNSREIIRIISKCNQTRRTISLGTLKCGCKKLSILDLDFKDFFTKNFLETTVRWICVVFVSHCGGVHLQFFFARALQFDGIFFCIINLFLDLDYRSSQRI